MSKKYKILQVIGHCNYGGVEKIIYDYFKNIDKDKFVFDFVVIKNSIVPYKKEIEQMGGKVYYIASFLNPIKQMIQYKKIMKDNNYDIIQSNINTLSFLPLYVAKTLNIKKRILFNHSTSSKEELFRNLIKFILKPLARKFTTNNMACSNYSGKWIFGKNNYFVLNNAVNIEDYVFNLNMRKEFRKKYNIKSNEILLGNIGRLCKTKNQLFMLDVFRKLILKRKDIKLVLVGTGKYKTKIKKRIIKYNLKDKVIMIDKTNKMQEIFSAIDILVHPSLYEGNCLTIIEAQISNLKCFINEKLVETVSIFGDIKFLKLEKDIWIEELLKVKINKNRKTLIESYDYDISNRTKELEKYYSGVLHE